MAKKQSTKIGTEVKGTTPAPTKTSTPVRNSAIPKVSGVIPASTEVTHEMIASRAYEISTSGGGSELDNWLRAERELLGL